MNSLFALTRKLIDVPSVTGREREVGIVLGEVLAEAGFDPAYQVVANDRRNVMATYGTPRTVLCTHMDTVGPFFPSSETATHIHGRGACDTKGIAAAMISAASRLRSDGAEDFGLLFLVGEETTSDGARATVGLDWPTNAVIVGEPTGNVLASGHKGALNVALTATGRAAHSGYPELGVSAVDGLVDALVSLRSVDWGTDPVLGPGSCNVGLIEGGDAINVIPANASARVLIRVVDSSAECEGRLRAAMEPHPDVQIAIQGASDPVQCSTIQGWPSHAVSFGTDLPYLGHFGQRFLIGPGSIHDAHTDHECVDKAELVESVDLYVALVTRLLGGHNGD